MPVSSAGKAAGYGLKASRLFKRNEIITTYDGAIVQLARVIGKQSCEAGELTSKTHWYAMKDNDLVIIGVDRQSCHGRGGASMANAGYARCVNAKFTTAPMKYRKFMFIETTATWRLLRPVVLRALRDISCGEEILVAYNWQKWTSPQMVRPNICFVISKLIIMVEIKWHAELMGPKFGFDSTSDVMESTRCCEPYNSVAGPATRSSSS